MKMQTTSATGRVVNIPMKSQAELSVCAGRKNCKNIVESPTIAVPTDEPWEPDLEPGEYVIDAFVTWGSGDASYSWFIEVIEE